MVKISINWQETLCNTCSKANAIDCSWIGKDDLTNKLYLERYVPSGTAVVRQVSVTKCPYYEFGSLGKVYWKQVPLTIPEKERLMKPSRKKRVEKIIS